MLSDSIDVIVPNIAEFNLRSLRPRFRSAARQGFIEVGNRMADQCVFWSDGPRVLVLPDGLDRLWFADVHRALAVDEPPVITPTRGSGLLLDDLVNDSQALDDLRSSVDGRARVSVKSWGATKDLYRLADVMRTWGVEVDTDGPAEPDLWSSLYLESKMSCVDLATRLPGFRVPRNLTVMDETQLRGALAAELSRSGQAIVKSMHGVGGEGSAVVRDSESSIEDFWSAYAGDVLFQSFPLGVQEYVEHMPGLGCPAVDMKITDGGAEQVTLSTMAVSLNRYLNVTVGPGSLPDAEHERLLVLADVVGQAARDLGYRGWLCVDCVVGTDGHLYVTEFNARRSGAMHSIALLRRFESANVPAGGLVTHSDDAIPVTLAGSGASYSERVRPVFERLWADGVRAYPTVIRGLNQARPSIGAMAAGSTVAEAVAVIAAIREALSTDADSGSPNPAGTPPPGAPTALG